MGHGDIFTSATRMSRRSNEWGCRSKARDVPTLLTIGRISNFQGRQNDVLGTSRAVDECETKRILRRETVILLCRCHLSID